MTTAENLTAACPTAKHTHLPCASRSSGTVVQWVEPARSKPAVRSISISIFHYWIVVQVPLNRDHEACKPVDGIPNIKLSTLLQVQLTVVVKQQVQAPANHTPKLTCGRRFDGVGKNLVPLCPLGTASARFSMALLPRIGTC